MKRSVLKSRTYFPPSDFDHRCNLHVERLAEPFKTKITPSLAFLQLNLDVRICDDCHVQALVIGQVTKTTTRHYQILSKDLRRVKEFLLYELDDLGVII